MKGKKRFDFIIGNPPYHEDNNANSRKSPIYNNFMDHVYQLADHVELITPARFLFRAGQTPKDWNEKILNDSHFKVLFYEPDASKFFPNTEIKGGVAVTYYDVNKDFEPVKIFIHHQEIKNILTKVKDISRESLSSIISNRGMYRFSETFFNEDKDRSQKLSDGTGNMLTSKIFEIFPDVFNKSNGNDTIPIYGRLNNVREYRYIDKRYIQPNKFIDYYNVIIPEANGNGEIGEKLVNPEILAPNSGHTDTFISIGHFDTKHTAYNCLKYIKCKFTRILLGILKKTQHNPAPTWTHVPLQDFSGSSDIDWTKSIPEIDQQLYKKYGLDDKEIEFIETHVKEMQ